MSGAVLRSNKAAAQSREHCARSRLRRLPGNRSPPRWRRPIFPLLKPRNRKSNALDITQDLRGVFETHRGKEKAGPRERFRCRADPLPHRRRQGHLLCRAGRTRADHPRDRGGHQPLPGWQTRCAPLLPFAAKSRACRAARADSRTTAPTSSPPSAASPPPFTA